MTFDIRADTNADKLSSWLTTLIMFALLLSVRATYSIDNFNTNNTDTNDFSTSYYLRVSEKLVLVGSCFGSSFFCCKKFAVNQSTGFRFCSAWQKMYFLVFGIPKKRSIGAIHVFWCLSRFLSKFLLSQKTDPLSSSDQNSYSMASICLMMPQDLMEWPLYSEMPSTDDGELRSDPFKPFTFLFFTDEDFDPMPLVPGNLERIWNHFIFLSHGLLARAVAWGARRPAISNCFSHLRHNARGIDRNKNSKKSGTRREMKSTFL